MRPPGQRQRRLLVSDGVEPIGIARGRHVGPRPLLDEPLACRGVRLREQRVGGDFHEVRVAVVRVAVGEGELDRLDETVQVRRRVVAEGLEVDAVEEVEHLEQRRPLTPEAARGDVVTAERGPQCGAHLDAELGEVTGGERSAFDAVELGDALGRLAAIELIARRAHPGLTAAARLRFGPGHAAERLAQLALHENLTHAKRPAVPQVEGRRGRPASVLVGVRSHLIGGELRDRKAALGMLGGGGGDFGEGHRAPPLERRAPGIRRRRHDRTRQSRWNLAAVALAEVRRRRGARVRADAGDLPGLPGARDVHQDRRHARNAHHVAVDDTQSDTSGDAGVDRVAARPQHT